MARRKRVLDDDDSDSSAGSDPDLDNDPDAREERALFENPYQNKRRRKNGKEDALYGVFADDSEDEGFGRKGKKDAGGPKKSDWTKAPAFVSGDTKVDLDKAMQIDEEGNEGSSDEEHDNDDNDSDRVDGSGGGSSDESESSQHSRASPRVREDEVEPLETSRMGGIGSSSAKASDTTLFSRGGIGASRSSVNSGSTTYVPTSFPGLSKGGIGSSRASHDGTSSDNANSNNDARPPMPSSSTSFSPDNLPSAFGNRGQRSFVRDAKVPAKPAVPLNPAELAHFNKLQGSFGARMLAKMGWQAGTGLGTTGEGIVTPVESKLRPQKIGIAFKGFKEKTEQSKMEARRRGEVVSDDEDVKTRKMKKKVKEQAEKRSDAWKRPKKVKTKVEHKTYEQIVAEAGLDVPASGIGQIIDATGAVPREVSSLADISLNSWSPSNDPTRIPEVRHNIRLIAEACKNDLDGLAREAKALEERKKLANREDVRLRKKVDDEAELIRRLQQVQLVANDINAKAKELSSAYELSLEPFSPLFYRLVEEFAAEFERYRLDEIVVAAIAPLVRRMVASWDPLEDPTAFITTFRNWRRALKVNSTEIKPPEAQVDVYGSKTVVAKPVEIEKPMTPFESLLWNIWLPKIRASINNDWVPDTPRPAVKLYEAWSTFLPPFIRDNLLDQLILPKVKKAVADWNPRKEQVPLQAIVFPWLPHVGLRMEDMIGDAKRKVKSLLRSWTVGQDVPADLNAWKDVFDSGEWDGMLLKYVVPKLGATLRDDFRINPRDQKMEPLQHVLLWSNIIRPSIFSQILETEFFPQWLNVLHIWLIQPRVSFEEVAQWYSFWKGTFPDEVQNMNGVGRGFTRGLQLMNKAIELGPDAPTLLARPDFRAEISTPNTPATAPPKAPLRASARAQEITFRSIVEEFASSHNLLFIPTGRAHERSRMPLFRVSPTVDGKGGLLVYIYDDAVWAKGDGAGGTEAEYKAISLDDMVLRASV